MMKKVFILIGLTFISGWAQNGEQRVPTIDDLLQVKSIDGKSIAFTAIEATPQTQKDRKEHLGDYDVVRKDYNHVHLWTLDVAEAMNAPVTGTQRTKMKDFSVGGFNWSPDGTKIIFSSAMGNPKYYSSNSRLIIFDTNGGAPRSITA